MVIARVGQRRVVSRNEHSAMSGAVAAVSERPRTPTSAAPPAKTPLWKRLVPIVVGLAVLLGVISFFRILDLQDSHEALACDVLESNEIEESRHLLEQSLSANIAVAESDLVVVRSSLRDAGGELEDNEEALKTAQDDLARGEDVRDVAQTVLSGLESDLESAVSEDGDGAIALLTRRIAEKKETVDETNAMIGFLNETIGSLNEAIGSLRETIESFVGREEALEVRLEAKKLARIAILVEDRAGSDDGNSTGYFPPPSGVDLVPELAVDHITLGPHRTPSSVEIPLGSVRSIAPQGSSAVAEEEAPTEAPILELPDKASFSVAAGQFRRSEGIAIPAEQISVWARRVGSVVLLNVCVTPDGLHPGMYEGDVYIVDPSLNPAKVHVAVTAQSTWIFWLYSLVLLLPLLALAYLWITARISAGEDPWNLRHLMRWSRINVVAALVVGFTAVWANQTWGSSVLNAVAVIGVGLVAAVTAMTVVAGKVVRERDSRGDSEPQASAQDSQEVTKGGDIPEPVPDVGDGSS